MTVSTTTRALLATAALALLAGCAGGSTLAPSVSTQSHATQMAKGLPMVAPGHYANLQHQAFTDIGGKQTRTFINPDKKCKVNCYAFVIGSDNVYGNYDLYNGGASPSYIGTLAGYGGWGVASYGNDEWAIGSTTYDILVGNFSISGSTISANITAQLKGSYYSSGEYPYGMAFDTKGNLYANNWPTGSCVDEWTAAAIAGYAGSPLSPSATFCSSKMAYLYQFGIGGSTIYSSGYDPNFNSALDVITKFSKEKVTEDPIDNSLGGFPGGVAVTKKSEVYVNDQYGTVFGYAKGKGAANQSVNWGYSPNDCTDINLDYAQTTLWCADIYFTSTQLTSGIYPLSSPLGTVGSVTFQGSSNPVEEYLGIAAVSAQK